jgi:hypothetical protein
MPDRFHACVWIGRILQDKRDRRTNAAGDQQRKKSDKKQVHGPPDLSTGKGRGSSKMLGEAAGFQTGAAAIRERATIPT